MAQSYVSASATVAVTATLIATIPPSAGLNVLVQNTGSAAIFLGGPNVAISGATVGYSLAAGASVTLPASASDGHALYGIVAAATQPVTVLYPA